MLRDILDVISPRTCLVCGRRLDVKENIICSACLLDMPLTGFLDHPYDNEMAKAFWGRVKHFEKAFALFYHQSHADSARPVYQLKYFGKPDVGVDLGVLMGREMSQAGFFDDIDALVPVPLAPRRQRQRGYNQSEMIALGLHDMSHLPIYNKVVRRVAFNDSQTHKDRQDRLQNVEDAFRLVDGRKIGGKHLLIVDDVVTTGATVCAVAKQLQKVPDVRISVASIGYAGQWIPVINSQLTK